MATEAILDYISTPGPEYWCVRSRKTVRVAFKNVTFDGEMTESEHLWKCCCGSCGKVVTEKNSGQPATASEVPKARWCCRGVKANLGGPVHGWATVSTVLTKNMCITICCIESCIVTDKPMCPCWHHSTPQGSLCLKGQQLFDLKTWIVDISISLASASVQLRANQPHIHTKLVPSCKDTALNLQTRWLNYFLGWAARPHPGSHSKQMGGNWNRCLQMLQSGGMDSSHQANKWADWETVCL